MADTRQDHVASEDESWPRLVRWEWVLLAVVLIAIVVTRFPTLDQRLLETHAFRQTQTAFQTVGFHESGIDLLRPEVPVLGAPWTIPFEFPLFQALASVPMSWGIGADTANRITALGFFVVTAGALWALIRLVGGRRVAAIALVVFSFSPFALLWSRASMTEYLATAAALGWVISAVRWRQTSDWRWAVPGSLLGAVAATVKVTTAIPWVVLILLVGAASADGSAGARSWLRARLQPPFVLMLALPTLASLAWTLHADAVKGASEATSLLTSGALRGWNLGTMAQRISGTDWGVILDRVDSLILGRGWLVVGVVAVIVIRRQRAFWIGIALVPLLAVEFFFNLYRVHDYYLIAITPALAAILALGISTLVGWIRIPGRWQGIGLVVVTLLWLGLNLTFTQFYWTPAYQAFDRPGPSLEIGARTAPGDYAMVHLGEGADSTLSRCSNWRYSCDTATWSPVFLYYADRRGMMLTDFVTTPIMADQPDLDRYRLLWTNDPQGPEVEFASLRPWYSPVSGQSLVLGADPDELGDVSVMASTEEVLPDGPHESLALTGESIVCDGAATLAIPAGLGSAWLTISTEGDARALLGAGLTTVPTATRTLVWNRTSDDGTREEQHLACFGGGSITILSAVDPVSGYLRVAIDPPVPAQILLDGIPVSAWDSGWMKLPPGDYQVSFSDVDGFATPDAQTVTVTDGATTEVTGVFTARGWLRVITDPAVSATISVDGSVAGDSGVWTDLVVGSHEVCFVDVTYNTIRKCETVTLVAGETTTIALGSLRVNTNPAVPSLIAVDGVVYDWWSLDWLTLPPGDYEVSFSDVDGFTTPVAQTVTVTAGVTTEVTGVFAPQGTLQVITDPAAPAAISVDGVVVGDWGVWIDLAPGDHEVCFGVVTGLDTPDCQIATLRAGETVTITGTYDGSP